MKINKPRLNNILVILTIALVIYGISVFLISFINRWRDDVIDSHFLMTEIIGHQLQQYSENIFNDLETSEILNCDLLTTRDLAQIDSVLKALSNVILSEVAGLEGGFYISKFDEFVGYAYPTLPPPKPAYGPPPRSYDIIKQQIKATIETNQAIINLHQFDPAIFPLATLPIVIQDQVIAAAWVRIHIERKLPAYRLREILKVIATISVTGFIIAVAIFLNLQKRTHNIRVGLETIQKNPRYRFNIQGGTYGFIADSINTLVDNLDRENKALQKLEKELHQREKLASLGKLVAGVAHEVKTPLAIIKTRVQLWQRRLKENSSESDLADIITPESMELVVQEINRLTSLVNRLLVFSKPRNTELKERNINDLIRQTASFLRTENADIDIEEKYSDTLPLLAVDPNAMHQVLLNILTNSIQACDGNGKVSINTSLNRKKEKIAITITDNGCGIPVEIIDKIYDPFFTTKEGGAGLGLSISYEIIKAHDGTITFNNRDSGGTRCQILLPLN